MNITNKRFTPDYVDHLSECEIFVFGSNLDGRHTGGAAKIAYEKFGAEWGIGDGPTGRCYAIPTMFGSLKDISPYAKKFISYVKEHPNNRFLLTRVGCGIAGFKDIDVAQLFEDVLDIPNISYPRKWVPYLPIGSMFGTRVPRGRDDAPPVISDDLLKDLCQKHLYEIGANIGGFLPRIKARYVEEKKKFGYTDFGNFFFFGDDFYVWETDDKYAEYHNQDVVEGVFGDECEGRGYARRVLFAGVQTDFKDCNGEIIYTGDVIKIERDEYTEYLAVGGFASEDWSGYYCFLLDNHSWRLTDCLEQHYQMTRVGTVFYNLDANDFININKRTCVFNLENSDECNILMAKYTPSFKQECEGSEANGAKYDWKLLK